jgi:hypothetical protein
MGTVRTLDVEGYIAAPVLPLRDDGAIDLDGMDRYVRWIADDGPKALVVNCPPRRWSSITAPSSRRAGCR